MFAVVIILMVGSFLFGVVVGKESPHNPNL